MIVALPSPREEAWRWSDLSALPALIATTPRQEPYEVTPYWIGRGPRLTFLNGAYLPLLSMPGSVTVGPMTIESDHALGRLVGRIGWTHEVAAGANAGETIEILNVATGGGNHLPARIVLAGGAQASIVETLVGDGWSNRLTEIVLGEGASLQRNVRMMQIGGFTSLREVATLARNSRLVSTFLGVGAADTRIDAAVTLAGDDAFADIGGVLLARGHQRQEAAMVVRHVGVRSVSRQTWRAVAEDHAIASLAARVEIAKNAQQTDAAQSLRGLLMARTAAINLKPELEIFADDVKAAHGATVGALDPDALFYLVSRGISETQARGLLTQSFAAAGLERIKHPILKERFGQATSAWLE